MFLIIYAVYSSNTVISAKNKCINPIKGENAANSATKTTVVTNPHEPNIKISFSYSMNEMQKDVEIMEKCLNEINKTLVSFENLIQIQEKYVNICDVIKNCKTFHLSNNKIIVLHQENLNNNSTVVFAILNKNEGIIIRKDEEDINNFIIKQTYQVSQNNYTEFVDAFDVKDKIIVIITEDTYAKYWDKNSSITEYESIEVLHQRYEQNKPLLISTFDKINFDNNVKIEIVNRENNQKNYDVLETKLADNVKISEDQSGINDKEEAEYILNLIQKMKNNETDVKSNGKKLKKQKQRKNKSRTKRCNVM